MSPIAEEIGDRTGVPERHQRRMHALLLAAVLDQMQPPTRPLTLGALREARQPDRRHQLAPRELSQHPRIDPVGLARQRRQALDLDRVGDLNLPAATLKRVVHEPRPGHRLDRRAYPDRPKALIHTPREPVQAVKIGRRRPLPNALACLAEQTDIQPPAAQIQSSMQHVKRASSGRLRRMTRWSVPPGEALLHHIQCGCFALTPTPSSVPGRTLSCGSRWISTSAPRRRPRIVSWRLCAIAWASSSVVPERNCTCMST
jgi:hypothetical protein